MANTQSEILAIEGIESSAAERIERSKRAQAAYISEASPIAPIPTNIGLKKAFEITLDKADKAKPSLFTDTLSQPEQLPQLNPQLALQQVRKNVYFEVAKIMEKNEQNISELVDVIIRNIKYDRELIIELTKEDEKRLQEILEVIKKNEKIDSVKHLLNILSSSIAITMGSILLAPETAATIATTAAGAALYASISSTWSYLLIASGLSNLLTSEIFPKIGFFEKIASFFTSDKKQQTDLSEKIKISAALTNSVMTLVSTIATSPLFSYISNWGNALQIIEKAIGLSSTTTNAIDHWHRSELTNLESEKTLTSGKLTSKKMQQENKFNNLESLLENQKSLYEMQISISKTLTRILNAANNS